MWQQPEKRQSAQQATIEENRRKIIAMNKEQTTHNRNTDFSRPSGREKRTRHFDSPFLKGMYLYTEGNILLLFRVMCMRQSKFLAMLSVHSNVRLKRSKSMLYSFFWHRFFFRFGLIIIFSWIFTVTWLHFPSLYYFFSFERTMYIEFVHWFLC